MNRHHRKADTVTHSTTSQPTDGIGAILLAIVASGLLAAACTRAAAKAAPPPPPEVSIIQVKGENVSTYREYPGPDLRARPGRSARTRRRLRRYRRSFDIGSDVRAGQVLYVLDVRPYEAEVGRAQGALAQATADIAQAEANLLKARQDVARLEPLVKEEAAAKQDLDNATRRAARGRRGGGGAQGDAGGEPRRPPRGGIERRLRDDSRADRRTRRRQRDADRRARHQGVSPAADDHRAARSRVGALPDQRSGAVDVFSTPTAARRCRSSWSSATERSIRTPAASRTR